MFHVTECKSKYKIYLYYGGCTIYISEESGAFSSWKTKFTACMFKKTDAYLAVNIWTETVISVNALTITLAYKICAFATHLVTTPTLSNHQHNLSVLHRLDTVTGNN